MTTTAASVAVAVAASGEVSGVAWVTPVEKSLDLHVMGKVSIALDRESATIVRPESPGVHLGMQALEEIGTDAGRRLLVRGARHHPGRVMLRRGETTLVDLAFGPGTAHVTAPLTGGMNTTMTGERGEWLVVEGAEHPQSRRWCKLPKLGLIGTFREGREKVVLKYKVLCVDVSSWIVSFIYKGAKPLGRSSVPASLSIAAMTVDQIRKMKPAAKMNTTAEISPFSEADPKTLPFDRTKQARLPPFAMYDYKSTGTIDLAKDSPELTAPFASDTTEDERASDLPAVKSRPSRVSREVPAAAPAPLPPLAPKPAPVASRSTPAGPAEPSSLRAEIARRVKAREPLTGLSLRGAALQGISLEGADLSNVDATLANLMGADLRGANLRGAKLDDARLDGANLESAALDGAKLERATFQHANLKNASLDGSEAIETSFEGATLERARLRGAKLVGARLTRVLGSDLEASRADLTGADLSGARLERASFAGATLHRAALRGTRFSGADLSNADLRQVSGENTLQGANVSGAKR